MWTSLLIILACLAVFERSSNYLVEGLGAISQHFDISEAVLGASIAAMGSSAPEFGSSFFSVVQGHWTIGLGTIVGSAIFNVTVIVGAAAIFGKYAIEKRVFYRDGLFYLLTVGIAIVGVWDGSLSRFEAIIWALIFFVYLAVLVRDARTGKLVPKESFEHLAHWRAAVYVIVSAVAIAVAARFLVGSVEEFTSGTEGQAAFSLIVVAIGTSVPDLFTSLQASRRGMGSMAVSNALGSNVFDILAALGIPFSFRTTTEIETLVSSSLAALFGSVVLVLAILRFDWSVSRKEGVILIGAYGAFLCFVLLS